MSAKQGRGELYKLLAARQALVEAIVDPVSRACRGEIAGNGSGSGDTHARKFPLADLQHEAALARQNDLAVSDPRTVDPNTALLDQA